jgi:two-component system sensor histidine kinase/response regulator
VVDDVAASCDSLARKLRSFNFDPICVASVEQALIHLATDADLSLVLADELMPQRGGIDLLTAMRQDPRTAQVPFVLLSLFGAEHDLENWEYRPNAIGSKPVRAPRLVDLICNVLSGSAPSASATPVRHVALPTFAGRRLLLVEDNPVNQKVAQRVLQKLSVSVTTANNGAEALERVAEIEFDAVLMDCQMPVMDGFTATKHIRERELELHSGRRLPIIALTANVMTKDRQKCIAAGMDAHLGKPFDPNQLADCLGRYWRVADTPAEIDMQALRELTGGDFEFERELVDTFVSTGDKCLAEIRAALEASDFDTVGKRAHALKGASANIHAHTLSAAASSLEQATRASSYQDIDSLVRDLGERLRAVNAQLVKAS